MTTEITGVPCSICGEESAVMSQMDLVSYETLYVGASCLPAFFLGMALSFEENQVQLPAILAAQEQAPNGSGPAEPEPPGAGGGGDGQEHDAAAQTAGPPPSGDPAPEGDPGPPAPRKPARRRS